MELNKLELKQLLMGLDMLIESTHNSLTYFDLKNKLEKEFWK